MDDQAAVRLQGVTFTYPGAAAPALQDVSLSIDRGDFIAIAGSNGSAKSTLCKAMNGLIPHFYTGDFLGEATVNGLSTAQHSVSELARHVGYVYQDFENQLVRPTVLDEASFGPLNYGYADYRERGMRALRMAGLTADPTEFIWQLSGGQKHLLALAGVIALEPKVIIIDEPVAQLDPRHARVIYDTLRKLNEEHGITVIVIEHHTEFIAEYCRHVVLMSEGSVVWKLPTREALNRTDELLRHQIYPPQVTQAAERAELGMRSGSLPIRLEEAVHYFAHADVSNSIPDSSAPAEELGEQPKCLNDGRDPVIAMKDVCFSYRTVDRKKQQILRHVNLAFRPGELVAIVGSNGAGKSSLMRLLTGIVRPEQGSVAVQGIDTRTASPERLADIVTYIYQNPEDMFIEDSIRKDIAYFLKARMVEGYERRVDDILADFNLVQLQERDGRLLSGGQQRRASLAIGVAMTPSVMLLDEPTANLDMATRRDVARLLQNVRRYTDTVIIATHDMQLVAEWATRIVVMHEGRVLHDGTKDTVFGNSDLLRQADLSAPQVLELSRMLGMPLCYTVDEFSMQWAGRNKEANDNGAYTQAAR